MKGYTNKIYCEKLGPRIGLAQKSNFLMPWQDETFQRESGAKIKLDDDLFEMENHLMEQSKDKNQLI